MNSGCIVGLQRFRCGIGCNRRLAGGAVAFDALDDAPIGAEPVVAVGHSVGGQRPLPEAEFFGVRRLRRVGRSWSCCGTSGMRILTTGQGLC